MSRPVVYKQQKKIKDSIEKHHKKHKKSSSSSISFDDYCDDSNNNCGSGFISYDEFPSSMITSESHKHHHNHHNHHNHDTSEQQQHHNHDTSDHHNNHHHNHHHNDHHKSRKRCKSLSDIRCDHSVNGAILYCRNDRLTTDKHLYYDDNCDTLNTEKLFVNCSAIVKNKLIVGDKINTKAIDFKPQCANPGNCNTLWVSENNKLHLGNHCIAKEGPQGPKGDKGCKGEQGCHGLPGHTGAVGPVGPNGQQGIQGPQGLQGPVGPTGPQGATGATGHRGSKIFCLDNLLIGYTVQTSPIVTPDLVIGDLCLALSDSELFQFNGTNWQLYTPYPDTPFYYYDNIYEQIYVIKEVGTPAKRLCACIGDLAIDNIMCTLYCYDGCYWKEHCDLKGDTGPTGKNGIDGTVIECLCLSIIGRMGPTEPSVIPMFPANDGDYYLQFGNACNLYQYFSGVWVDKSNLVNVKDPLGNQVTEPFYFYGLDVDSGLYNIIYVINLANDICQLFTLREGDKVLDCCSGKLYEYDGTQWLSNCDLLGPTGHTGPTGATGETGASGATGTILECGCLALRGRIGLVEPSLAGPLNTPLTGVDGDLYLQHGNACNLYQYQGGNWIDKSSLVGLTDPLGNPVTVPFYYYGLNINTGLYQIIYIINLATDDCEEFVLRIDDKFLDCCSGQIYIWNGVEWVLGCNLMGHTGATGVTGPTGATGFTGATGTILECLCLSLSGRMGPAEPSLMGLLANDGDLYLQNGLVCNLYRYDASIPGWVDASDLSGLFDPLGNPVTLPFYYYALNVVSGYYQIVYVIDLLTDICEIFTMRIGDKILDCCGGGIYEFDGNQWPPSTCIMKGATGATGPTGITGVTGYTGPTGETGTIIECLCLALSGRMGPTEPSVVGLTGVDGDLYLQHGNACNLYKFEAGVWIDASDLNNLFDPLGNPVTLPFYYYGYDINTGLYQIIYIIDLALDICEEFVMRIGDKIIDCCSGNIYEYDGSQWLSNCNLRGPTGPTGFNGTTGVTGPTGPTGFTGATGTIIDLICLSLQGLMGFAEPSLMGITGIDGQYYLQNGNAVNLYRYDALLASWVDVSDLIGVFDPLGNQVTQPFYYYGLDVTSGLYHIIQVIDLFNDISINFELRIGDKIIDCCGGGIYEFNGEEWVGSNCSLMGPTGPTGSQSIFQCICIALSGRVGLLEPTLEGLTGNPGDLYLQNGNACNLYEHGTNPTPDWDDNSILANLFDPLGNPVTLPFYYYGFNVNTLVYELIYVIDLANDICEIVTGNTGDKLIDCCSNTIYSYDGTNWIVCCNLNDANCSINNYLDSGLTHVSVCQEGIVDEFGARGLVFSNTLFDPSIGPTGQGATGFFFNTDKSALRTGLGSTGSWGDANIGPYSFASGVNTFATGMSSHADGFVNQAIGDATYSGGILSMSPLDCQWSRANGGFSGTNGSAQYSIFHMGLETGSTGINQRFGPLGSGTYLNIPNNTAWTVFISIMGCDSTFSIITSCTITGMIINNAGTVTIPNVETTNVVVGDAGIPTLFADDVNNALEIRVTPLDESIIRWNASIQITNISF